MQTKMWTMKRTHGRSDQFNVTIFSLLHFMSEEQHVNN